MKLVIRQYLESLKEREELDAILPDLLSELGYTVYSRPGRGTTQHGVDVAAVGMDEDGERKIFLFSIKQGDLTRQDWDGTPQSLRPSLNEIRDAYIPSRIPTRYKDLKIVICICVGGEILEQVRTALTGYIKQNTTDKILFDEWNGDRIAGLLQYGILREEILPRTLRSSFQKAVAMVDEPDISYNHFSQLVNQLRERAGSKQKTSITAARQMYVCLWILFVWARDIDNLEAPYKVSELVVLNVWHLQRSFGNKGTKNSKAINTVLGQLINLHLIIALEFLEGKIIPHIDTPHALSRAVESQNWVDVNLRLFDLLGRMAMTGLWLFWLSQLQKGEIAKEAKQKGAQQITNCFKLISTNPTLFSPLCDEQAIDVALVLQLSMTTKHSQENTFGWLNQMVRRLDLAVCTHGKYTCAFTDYSDLINHPREQSEEYRKEATSGSILIPMLAAWLSALNGVDALKILVKLGANELSHCTLQLWLPDKETEENLYIGGDGHGITLCDLKVSATGIELLETINEACVKEKACTELSPYRDGYWPIILLACRHFRHPIPPHFWIKFLLPNDKVDNKAET